MRYDDGWRAGENPGPPRRSSAEGPKRTAIPVRIRGEQTRAGMSPAGTEPDSATIQGRRPAEQSQAQEGRAEEEPQQSQPRRDDAAFCAPSEPTQSEAKREWSRAGDPDRTAAALRESATSTATEAGVNKAANDLEDWRDRALRLQAEMDNFRRRQQRLAQDESRAERDRLLKGFLVVIDNLERALAAPAGDDDQFRQGVGLTHRAAMQFLEREGVGQIQAENRRFDPAWHEAVATVPVWDAAVEPNTVVQVTQPGYQVGERLLRPAKVVVAV